MYFGRLLLIVNYSALLFSVFLNHFSCQVSPIYAPLPPTTLFPLYTVLLAVSVSLFLRLLHDVVEIFFPVFWFTVVVYMVDIIMLLSGQLSLISGMYNCLRFCIVFLMNVTLHGTLFITYMWFYCFPGYSSWARKNTLGSFRLSF